MCTRPCTLQQTVRRPILQPCCMVEVVLYSHVAVVCTGAATRHNVACWRQQLCWRRGSACAVHACIPRLQHCPGPTAHLERAALPKQALHRHSSALCVRLERERLQEEDCVQARPGVGASGSGPCGASGLEVGGAREDDATLHDVVGDEGV